MSPLPRGPTSHPCPTLRGQHQKPGVTFPILKSPDPVTASSDQYEVGHSGRQKPTILRPTTALPVAMNIGGVGQDLTTTLQDINSQYNTLPLTPPPHTSEKSANLTPKPASTGSITLALVEWGKAAEVLLLL